MFCSFIFRMKEKFKHHPDRESYFGRKVLQLMIEDNHVSRAVGLTTNDTYWPSLRITTSWITLTQNHTGTSWDFSNMSFWKTDLILATNLSTKKLWNTATCDIFGNLIMAMKDMMPLEEFCFSLYAREWNLEFDVIGNIWHPCINQGLLVKF